MGYTGAKRAYDRMKELGVATPGYTKYFAKVTAVFARMSMASSGLKEVNIREQIESLFTGLDVKLDAPLLDEAVAAWYHPFSENSFLLEEAGPVLSALKKRGLRLGIISNSVWPGRLIEADLEKAGIRALFDCVVVSADVGFRKPSSTIFEVALGKLSLTPVECVFVGDSAKVDVAGAQQVGMRVILVAKEPEVGPEPDARIRSLAELESVLNNMT